MTLSKTSTRVAWWVEPSGPMVGVDVPAVVLGLERIKLDPPVPLSALLNNAYRAGLVYWVHADGLAHIVGDVNTNGSTHDADDGRDPLVTHVAYVFLSAKHPTEVG